MTSGEGNERSASSRLAPKINVLRPPLHNISRNSELRPRAWALCCQRLHRPDCSPTAPARCLYPCERTPIKTPAGQVRHDHLVPPRGQGRTFVEGPNVWHR